MSVDRASDSGSELAGQLERRRAAAAAGWNLGDEVVVIGAGDPVPVPGRYDRTYPFRSHSEYFYLTDRERPGGVLAFDPEEGWVDFVAPVTREELLWSGAGELEGAVPEGTRSRDDLTAWLEARRGRRCAALGAPLAELTVDAELEQELRYVLTDVRRPKDDVELTRMRRAEHATRAGHLAVAALIEEGRTERELQVELEAEFFRNGADALAFETIVGSGSHSAVLHFAPTDRRLAAAELVVVDAGGECRGYASDITRSYPVSDAFSAEQQAVYAIVREALEAGIRSCKPGAEWRDVHRVSALVVGEGLVDVGILRGDAESLFESGAITLFFPHGVGHMVGLGIRDAGGVERGREPPGPGFPPLRVDLPLRVGYTMTIEPGVYFVPPLLSDRETRARLRDGVDWARVDRLLGFGGIRLEENVLVTPAGCEVLTSGVPLLDG